MNDFVIRPISRDLQQQIHEGLNEVLGNPVSVVIATEKPGYPCRLSLQDAEVGEELYLYSHMPFAVANAYRETGPIFVRKNAEPAPALINQLPEVVLARESVIVRAYDVGGSVLEVSQETPECVPSIISSLLENPVVDFVHIRSVASGCFLCEARRAGS